MQALVVFTVSALLAGASFACGSETFVQAEAGATDAGSDSETATNADSALDAAMDAPARRPFQCGGATCTAEQTCCAYRTSEVAQLACEAPCRTDSSFAGALQCTSSTDCATGEVCCGTAASEFSPITSSCQTSCPPGELTAVMCTPAAPCGFGQECTDERSNGSKFPTGFAICQD